MRTTLDEITIRGFKTFQGLEKFRPGRLAVLIGPNGSGKSNFASFFTMMSRALAAEDGFRIFVAQQGGASKLLHDGPSKTPEAEAVLNLSTPLGKSQYSFRLLYAAGDTLIFPHEHHSNKGSNSEQTVRWQAKDSAASNTEQRESGYSFPTLLIHAADGLPTGATKDFLKGVSVYHFNNTSAVARIQTKWKVSDNRALKEDGGNIAPVLLRLKQEDGGYYYRRIVETIRLILPTFSDFDLQPEYGHVLLQWRERNSDLLFDVSQASDGMLRAICLITLLLQPEERLPDLLILDEPELGLHPYAIEVIGGLIHAASVNTQVIAATQSTTLVDCFAPEDIVVVDRNERASTFRRLDPESLDEWFEDYSLSELWQKNVIEGNP